MQRRLNQNKSIAWPPLKHIHRLPSQSLDTCLYPTSINMDSSFLPISSDLHQSSQNADMASKEELLLPRFDRLDMLVGYLEEIKGFNKSSCPSTPSSGTTTTDGGNSSVNSSPKSLKKRCRPINAVIVETQVKGNLVDRLLQLEERVLMLCKQLEQEIEGDQRKKEEEEKRSISEKKMKSNKGLKGVVKSCMGSSRLKPEV